MSRKKKDPAVKIKNTSSLAIEVPTDVEQSIYIEIGRSTIYKMRERKPIPYFNLDSSILCDKEDIDQWKEFHKTNVKNKTALLDSIS
jgi:predicted DNA-binding transcriptional regulator AlpA